MIKFIFYSLILLLCNTTILLASLPENNNITLGESIEKGKEKAKICATCHNIDGNSIIPIWPKLAGQFPTYMNAQLKAFKDNKKNVRQNQIMYTIVANLTEKDFIDLSNYFSTQKITKRIIKDKEKFEKGKVLYLFGARENEVPACAACHGSLGQGNEFAGFPKLHSQHPEYIIQQLENYKISQRTNDYNSIMRNIATKLNDEQIKNLAEYISSI